MSFKKSFISVPLHSIEMKMNWLDLTMWMWIHLVLSAGEALCLGLIPEDPGRCRGRGHGGKASGCSVDPQTISIMSAENTLYGVFSANYSVFIFYYFLHVWRQIQPSISFTKLSATRCMSACSRCCGTRSITWRVGEILSPSQLSRSLIDMLS